MNAMLTGTDLEVAALLAVLAVVHAVVSTFIARRLMRNEQVSAETQNNVHTGDFARHSSSGSDTLRKAA
jgi:hypothetical protein